MSTQPAQSVPPVAPAKIQSKMMRQLNPKIYDLVRNGTRDQRKYICKSEFLYFAIYYFPEFFEYPIAPFHYDFYEDAKRLAAGEVHGVAWIAFRESAKTSIAKLFLIWCIAYKKKRFINYDSYDKANAEAALFDIVVQLQTNRRLIADFGHLYFKKAVKEAMSEAKLKRVSNFITENGVKVEAFSTQESTRGRVFGHLRPDLYIFDDIETSKTKDSQPITSGIIKHVNEAKSGLGPNAGTLYLGNYISEDGVIAHIIHGTNEEPGLYKDKNAVVRFVPVREKGKIAWPGKYVDSEREAVMINSKMPDRPKIISLESKITLLGPRVFATEMLMDPSSSDDYYFDRERIRELMQKCKEPIKRVGEQRIWGLYNPKHRYGGGADTAEGIGGDANASVIINFSMRPARVVSTYADNLIKPGTFAWELKREGEMFGECFWVPEINNTGYATLAELTKEVEEGGCGYPNVYRREVKNKTTGKLMKEYGFRMTQATKPDIFAQFKDAVETGDLEILDQRLLEECLHFRNSDIRLVRAVEGMTRHFDLLTAAALAMEASRYAEVSHSGEKGGDGSIYMSKQKKGEYEG